MSNIEVTLLTRPGCHLCEDAHTIIEGVLEDFPRASLIERDISDDAELTAEYGEKIPVVMIDGQVHAIWRVKDEKFRAALKEAGA